MTTVKVKLNAGRISKSGKYPIVFQVVHDRKSVMLSTGLHIEPENFDPLHGKVVVGGGSDIDSRRVREMNKTISLTRRHINDQIKSFDNRRFTTGDIRRWYRQYRNPDTLFPYMERMIEDKRAGGKYGTANAYRSTLNSLKHYCPSLVRMADINVQFVRNYETYLFGRGVSPNTVAYYMRNFRTVYNCMVEDYHTRTNPNESPFRRIKTSPTRTIKRALTVSQIKTIAMLELGNNPKLELTRDMFMASFYMRGIAFVDLSYLQRKNIINGNILYYRRKTGTLVPVQIVPPLQVIIDRYASESRFVFPQIHLADVATAETTYGSYRTALIYYNRRLKQIGEMAIPDVILTGYMARHSWATAAKNMGAATSLISESLGHSSERITQVYLKNFDNSVINRLNSLVSEL